MFQKAAFPQQHLTFFFLPYTKNQNGFRLLTPSSRASPNSSVSFYLLFFFKCTISYPALNVRTYTHLDPTVASEVLAKRGLEKKKYVLYLSRVIEAKGIFELVEGFRASKLVAAGYTLLIVGRGEALADVTELTLGDPNIRHMTDMADWEKAAIFDAAACYVLPSKFHPTFVETFGIVITEAMLTNCGPVSSKLLPVFFYSFDSLL